MSKISAAAQAAQRDARRANGEFGNQQHSAPEPLETAAAGGNEPVSYTATYEEYHFGLPTSRHRKEQAYYVPREIDVQLPSFTSAEAPIAAVPPENPHGHQYNHEFAVVDGRWMRRAGDDPDAYMQSKFGRSGSEGDARQKRDQLEASSAVVDGAAWVADSEPGYRVQTFGFGGNHGGTSLSVASLGRHETHPEDGSAPADAIFRADELELAKAKAVEVALERGDTQSVDRIEQFDEQWELGPEAASVEPTWQRPVKLDLGPLSEYGWKYQASKDEIRQTSAAVLSDLDRQLEQQGVLTRTVGEDGVERENIDWGRVSDWDQREYTEILLDSKGLKSR